MTSFTVIGYFFVLLMYSNIFSNVNSKVVRRSNFPEISKETIEKLLTSVNSHTCSSKHAEIIYGFSFKIVMDAPEPSETYEKMTLTTYSFIKTLTEFLENYNDLDDKLQIFFHKKMFNNYIKVACMIIDEILDEKAWNNLDKYASSSNEKRRNPFFPNLPKTD